MGRPKPRPQGKPAKRTLTPKNISPTPTVVASASGPHSSDATTAAAAATTTAAAADVRAADLETAEALGDSLSSATKEAINAQLERDNGLDPAKAAAVLQPAELDTTKAQAQSDMGYPPTQAEWDAQVDAEWERYLEGGRVMDFAQAEKLRAEVNKQGRADSSVSDLVTDELKDRIEAIG